ncbi:MAG: MFS transporter [Bryobacteraceae bacterium]
MTEAPKHSAVRWRIVALLTGFSLVSYLSRMNISVAQQYMAPEMGLSDIQIGQIFSAFMIGYALFQVPAGVWGDRRGPRLVLAAAAFSWGFLTILTGLLPGIVFKGAAAAFLSLLLIRFLLGVGEAATYPVAALAIGRWMPVREHAFSNAVVIAGATAGSAFTPPIVAALMQNAGWRASFYVTSLFSFVIAALWWWQGKDRPEDHSGVAASELALIREGRSATKSPGVEADSWLTLFRSRNVLLLSLSYFFDSYTMFIFVFWLYKYLVDVRKFSLTDGGWATSLPFVVATVMVPLLGWVSDRLSVRFGTLAGRRMTAMSCLVASGLLLFLGVGASSVWIAIAAICLSVGFINSTEGPYWSTAISLAGPHGGAAGGMMNMAGNLGGVACTSLVPVLVALVGWPNALASGTVAAGLGAVLWLLVRPGADDKASPESHYSADAVRQ